MFSRKELLLLYRKAWLERDEYDGIDKYAILRYLDGAIAVEEEDEKKQNNQPELGF